MILSRHWYKAHGLECVGHACSSTFFFFSVSGSTRSMHTHRHTDETNYNIKPYVQDLQSRHLWLVPPPAATQENQAQAQWVSLMQTWMCAQTPPPCTLSSSCLNLMISPCQNLLHHDQSTRLTLTLLKTSQVRLFFFSCVPERDTSNRAVSDTSTERLVPYQHSILAGYVVDPTIKSRPNN